MSLEDEATQELAALAKQGRRRDMNATHRETRERSVCFSSNDYLGLADRRWSSSALAQSVGAGASRLISGDRGVMRELERSLAAWIGLPSGLVFSSGFAANLGVMSALAGPDVEVFSDELNHASIIDGCRLARAQVRIYPHCDLGALEAMLSQAPSGRRRLVVTESVFSMDGDQPNLVEVAGLAKRHGAALIVDEAHAIGVVGPSGRGACAAAGVVPDLLIATFGKALGLTGAAVLSTPAVRELMWNRGRSLVFSTAISPLIAACALESVALVSGPPGDQLRAVLSERWRQLGAAIPALGRPLPGRGQVGPIASLLLGSESRTLAAAEALLQRGLWVHPIRPPTVPVGASRLRVTLSASHQPHEIDQLIQALIAEGLTPPS